MVFVHYKTIIKTYSKYLKNIYYKYLYLIFENVFNNTHIVCRNYYVIDHNYTIIPLYTPIPLNAYLSFHNLRYF